jgi:hypothetical protein
LLRTLAAEFAAQDRDLTEAECRLKARDELARRDANPYYAREVDRVAPQVQLPRREGVEVDVETRAWLDHPLMVWLTRQLTGDARDGRRGNRGMLIAGLYFMVSHLRPELARSMIEIAQSRLRMWAHRRPPRCASRSARYGTLAAMLGRHPPGLAVHVNLEMVLELASLRRWNGGTMFIDPLRYLAVDGTLIPANCAQNPPRGRSPRERKRRERHTAGPDRPMAQFVVYKSGRVTYDAANIDDDPNVRVSQSHGRSCFGYKLVVIFAIALQVPVIWMLIPATGDEREAARRLIRALYRLIPDYPARYLVGDGLYGTEKAFGNWLDRRYGLVDVFPLQVNLDKGLPFRSTLGVPRCRHGLAKHLGVRGEWAPERRRAHGLLPGQPAPESLRHRWGCRANDPRCTEITGTNADWDPRLYGRLPFAGDSRDAALRDALSAYRNPLESLFSAVKIRGVGGIWPSRMRFGGDDDARWVISLALLRVTAVRLAHASGTYEHKRRRAVEIGLIEDGPAPLPRDAIAQLSSEQQTMLEHDTEDDRDARPPRLLARGIELPIDMPYRLTPLTQYSDIPDR